MNLSDLAAKGATPDDYLRSLCRPALRANEIALLAAGSGRPTRIVLAFRCGRRTVGAKGEILAMTVTAFGFVPEIVK